MQKKNLFTFTNWRHLLCLNFKYKPKYGYWMDNFVISIQTKMSFNEESYYWGFTSKLHHVAFILERAFKLTSRIFTSLRHFKFKNTIDTIVFEAKTGETSSFISSNNNVFQCSIYEADYTSDWSNILYKYNLVWFSQEAKTNCKQKETRFTHMTFVSSRSKVKLDYTWKHNS